MIFPAIVAATTPLVMKVHRLKPEQDNHHYLPPAMSLPAFLSPRNFFCTVPPPGDDVEGAGQAVTLLCFFLYPAGIYLTCWLEGRRISFSFKGLLTFISRIKVKTNSNFLMMNVSQSVCHNQSSVSSYSPGFQGKNLELRQCSRWLGKYLKVSNSGLSC